MTALAFALALAANEPAPAQSNPLWYGGRVYTSDAVHVGVRPAAYADVVDGQVQEVAMGFTVQVTTRVPW